jgi:hypothetical protein
MWDRKKWKPHKKEPEFYILMTGRGSGIASKQRKKPIMPEH